MKAGLQALRRSESSVYTQVLHIVKHQPRRAGEEDEIEVMSLGDEAGDRRRALDDRQRTPLSRFRGLLTRVDRTLLQAVLKFSSYAIPSSLSVFKLRHYRACRRATQAARHPLTHRVAGGASSRHPSAGRLGVTHPSHAPARSVETVPHPQGRHAPFHHPTCRRGGRGCHRRRVARARRLGSHGCRDRRPGARDDAPAGLRPLGGGPVAAPGREPPDRDRRADRGEPDLRPLAGGDRGLRAPRGVLDAADERGLRPGRRRGSGAHARRARRGRSDPDAGRALEGGAGAAAMLGWPFVLL